MLPDFLADFRSQLEAYQLSYVQVFATPLRPGETLPLTQSKFAGYPYLPVGTSYPLDEAGQPMVLWAQINFAEVPALLDFPAAGILQFFVSAADWYDMDCRVLYHASTGAASQTDFSFLTAALYDESPVQNEHALAFSPATDYGCPGDVRFDFLFGGLDYYEYWEMLPEAQREELDAYFNNDGHKLGGYAYFTQRDPRDNSAGSATDVQLLQIDSGSGIWLGDAGLAHFFISPAALRARQFDQAYLYWDCC